MYGGAFAVEVTGQMLPPAVKAGSEPYTCKTDLWQIGQLVLTHAATPSAASRAYAHQLIMMSGQFTSAANAPMHGSHMADCSAWCDE